MKKKPDRGRRWPEWMNTEERLFADKLLKEKSPVELVQMYCYLKREHNDLQINFLETFGG